MHAYDRSARRATPGMLLTFPPGSCFAHRASGIGLGQLFPLCVPPLPHALGVDRGNGQGRAPLLHYVCRMLPKFAACFPHNPRPALRLHRTDMPNFNSFPSQHLCISMIQQLGRNIVTIAGMMTLSDASDPRRPDVV
jgi:hypothetical protein